MIFGQEVVELLKATRYQASSHISVSPFTIQQNQECIEILTGGQVEFGNKYYGKGAIFRHIEGDTTIHISAPGKPYQCLSLIFKIKNNTKKRDFPRLTFWQEKHTLKDFVKNAVEGFHDPESDSNILGAYIYSSINWHSSRSTAEGDLEDIPKSIRKAIIFLNEHTESWIPVKELSDITGLSKPYFQTLFKKYTGTTPHRYHLAKRIGLASEKLAFGEETVKAISDECGFDNIESFYRAFKKITNTTPAQYRRQHSARFWN